MTNLRSYIEKCFKDAFITEKREYDENLWEFEYIIIKNSSNTLQLFPVITWCKYDRVLHRVLYRLENNLMKNFGIHYGRTDELRSIFYTSGEIDPNFTTFMFKTSRGNISMSIFDAESDSRPNGECMSAYRYEKLIFKYYGLDANSYNNLSEGDSRKYLPNSLNNDWEAFKELYESTFNAQLGSNYEIICSSGIEIL